MIQGLVIKTQSYQEHARLLFTYTPKGKVTLIAKGAQKLNSPLRVIGQYMTLIAFEEVSNKTMYTLKEAKIMDDYHAIKSDYQLIKHAAVILEIIDDVIDDHLNHDVIFQHAISAMSVGNIAYTSLAFSLKILTYLGYGLSLKPDGRTIKGVGVQRGGIIYQDESDDIDLNVKESTIILQLIYQPYHVMINMDEHTYNSIKKFIVRYYQYHLQTTLKALK